MEDHKPEQLAVCLADRKGRRFGTLVLDAKAVATVYNGYHATEDRWGTPPDAKAMMALLPPVLIWLSGRIAQDLPVAVSIALKDPDRQIGNTAGAVRAAAKAWRRASIGLSRLRLDALLDLPATEVIPKRPKLHSERDLSEREDVSLGDYMVGALLAEQRWNRLERHPEGASTEATTRPQAEDLGRPHQSGRCYSAGYS